MEEDKPELDAMPSTSAGKKRSAFAKHEASKENQPFNIGTHSSVKKQTAADLALSADELEDLETLPKSKSTTKAKGARAPRASKTKAKAAVKVLDSSEDELGLKSETEDEDEDFAMDSDDEERQLKQAIKASQKVARAGTSSAGTSSAASSTGKARGKKAVKGGNLLRTAAKKAASRMCLFQSMSIC
jgi:DNA repair protein RAD16